MEDKSWKDLNKYEMMLKRLIDLIMAISILSIIMPMMAIIAVLIKLDSRGPIIFIDKRLGKGEIEFNCYKFRSMYINADDILDNYLVEHQHLKAGWHRYAKMKETDPRVTKVGAVIRKLSLDELPQIINVIKGEMSIVGPRPYLPREKERMQGSEIILQVLPGITGYWQVNGRNDIDFAERLKMDIWYVENRSLGLDFKILLSTIKVIITSRGAF